MSARCGGRPRLGDDALKEKSLEKAWGSSNAETRNDHASVPWQPERDPGRAQGLPGGRVGRNEGLARVGLRRSWAKSPAICGHDCRDLIFSHANRSNGPLRPVRPPDVGQSSRSMLDNTSSTASGYQPPSGRSTPRATPESR